MKNQKWICKKVDSLNCFLDRAKGHYCMHSEPHGFTKECSEEICVKTDDHYYLRGCSCKRYEENNN